MDQNNNLPQNDFNDDELDLSELFGVLWSQKGLVIKCILVVSILGTIYALTSPNIYTSRTLLSPTQIDGGISSPLDGYSRLASIAGINLPSATTSNEKEAIATLNSFNFFKNSFLPNIFFPDLLAIQSWDDETNTISYDDDLYDIEAGKWVGGVRFPNTTPSAQSAFGLFLKENYSVYQDKTTGFVTLNIKHKSPHVAKDWLDIIVLSINKTLREDQKKRSMASIEYLNKQIAQTSYTEIKQELSSLIQQETEKLMLVEANEDYAFKVIDPPIVPEFPSEPDRFVIVILAAIVGGFIGVLIVFVRYFSFENN